MNNSENYLNAKIIGHCKIIEHQTKANDDGKLIIDNSKPSKVLVNKCNAVHPQNMARVITRALANESNYFIHRVAFGNGGTIVDTAQTITYKPPRDGLNPGDNGWQARLYNETYSEIVDDSNVNIGTGIGSSPLDDPTSIEHISGPGVRSIEDLTENSIISSVVIQIVLNPNEPSGQVNSNVGVETNTESNFTFDEIALMTSGASHVSSSGFQQVDVGNKRGTSDTGLLPATVYQFILVVDNGLPVNVQITTPAIGSGDGIDAPLDAITYDDLIFVLNPAMDALFPSGTGAVASITNDIPTQSGGTETYGYLKFTSKLTGSNTKIVLQDMNLFSSLTGFQSILTDVPGENIGDRNNPTNPSQERERMLTHLIFSPVLKSANSAYTIVYTLNVVVARSH